MANDNNFHINKNINQIADDFRVMYIALDLMNDYGIIVDSDFLHDTKLVLLDELIKFTTNVLVRSKDDK